MEAGVPIPLPADLVMFSVGERVAARRIRSLDGGGLPACMGLALMAQHLPGLARLTEPEASPSGENDDP
jgi:hypothetical protein